MKPTYLSQLLSTWCGSLCISCSFVPSTHHGKLHFRSLVVMLCWTEWEDEGSTTCILFSSPPSLGGWKGALGVVKIKNKSETHLSLTIRGFFICYILYESISKLKETTKIFQQSWWRISKTIKNIRTNKSLLSASYKINKWKSIAFLYSSINS